MRCMIVLPSLLRAGAETQAVDLANGLADRGHAIHLCCFEPQIDQRARVSDAVGFHHFLRRSRYDRGLMQSLAQVIDGERIDVVLGVLQYAAFLAWRGAARSTRRPPVVAAVHTTVNRGLKEELQDRLIYRRMLRRMPAVIFVCRHQRDHWVTKYPELERSSRVIHNGVDPGRFRREDFETEARELRVRLSIPDHACVFACIAAFRPEKGHRILLEAFSRLPDNCYLILAGDGEQRRVIETIAQRKGLARRVRFVGNVPDVRPIVVASSATVLASTSVETFSMAMLESMALGVPMIAPRIGGLAEAIVHDETGMLFEAGDTDALTANMRDLAGDHEKVVRIGRAAEAKVAAAFTLEQMVSHTEQLLQETLGVH